MAIRLSACTEPCSHSKSDGPDPGLLYEGKADVVDSPLVDEEEAATSP